MALEFRSVPLRAVKPTPRAQSPSAARASIALGQVLLDRNLITQEQLTIAIEHQRTSNKRLGQVLLDLGFTTPDAVLGALSIQLGVPTARLNGFSVSAAAVQALPEKIARKHMAVPLQKIGVLLQVAIARPNDLAALDDLRFACGWQIQTFLALESEIEAALNRFYADDTLDAVADDDTDSVLIETVEFERRDTNLLDRRQGKGRRKTDQYDDDTFDEATEQTAVRTVDRILARAASAGSSDIHLERTPQNLRVRFRVDGTFHDIGCISTAVAPAICARLKVLAGMGHRRTPSAAGRSSVGHNRRAAAGFSRVDVSDDSRREARSPRARSDGAETRAGRAGHALAAPRGLP